MRHISEDLIQNWPQTRNALKFIFNIWSINTVFIIHTVSISPCHPLTDLLCKNPASPARIFSLEMSAALFSDTVITFTHSHLTCDEKWFSSSPELVHREDSQARFQPYTKKLIQIRFQDPLQSWVGQSSL